MVWHIHDPFSYADNNALGVNWEYISDWSGGIGDTFIMSGTTKIVQSGGASSAFHYKTQPGNDQYSKVKIVATGSQYVGISARATTTTVYIIHTNYSGSGTTYPWMFTSGSGWVYIGGSTAASPGWAANDTIEIRCVGTSVKVFKNGNQVHDFTESVIASGKVGVTASGGGIEYDDWEGGDYPPVHSYIKTKNGLAYASVKTSNGLASASVKTINGLT